MNGELEGSIASKRLKEIRPVAYRPAPGNTAILLWMAANQHRLDARRGADASAIVALRERMERFTLEHSRIPRLADTLFILAIGFGATGLSHALAAPLSAGFNGGWLAGQLMRMVSE